MVRLDNPWTRHLCRRNFEEYSLWVWDDENEGYLPISDGKYTTEYGTLFIKATFKLQDKIYDGYLVGFDSYYSFCIFIKENQFQFNISLNSMIDMTTKKIFKELNCKPFDLFPLYYNSPVCLENGHPISGSFVLKNGELFNQPDNPNEKPWSRSDFEKSPVWKYDLINGRIAVTEKTLSTKDYWEGLFIKAYFITTDEQIFEGFLIGHRKFFSFGLFIRDETILFNLADFNSSREELIHAILKGKQFNLFPLRYTSQICSPEGSPISGQFILTDNKLHCIPDQK